MASMWLRSRPEAVELIRVSQEDLWKTSPQDASFNEDVFVVYDQEMTTRAERESTITPSLADGPVRQSIEIITPSLAHGPVRQTIETIHHQDVPGHVVDHTSTHTEDPIEAPMSAETEAALGLLNLKYSGIVREYVHDDTNHTTSLHPFNSKTVANADPPKFPQADAVSETEPHEPTAGQAVQKSASPQGQATKVPDGDDCQQPRKGSSTKANKLPSKTRASLVRCNQTQPRLPAAVKGQRTLRSSIEIHPISTTPQPKRMLRSTNKPLDDINRGARSSDLLNGTPVRPKRIAIHHGEIKDDEDDDDVPVRRKARVVRYIESEDEEKAPLTPINKSPAENKQKQAGDSTQAEKLRPRTNASLVRRQPARNLKSSNKPLTGTPKASPATRSGARQSGRSRDSPLGRKRRHEEVEDDEGVSVHRKSRSFRKSENENEEGTSPVPIKNSIKRKSERAVEKPQRLINPPVDLPRKAPAATPGIPNDALAIDEYFQKNARRTLGVQLPKNRTRTQWEWVPYIARKAGNAQFDWANDQHLKDVNRWRQQRIRRRFAEHGVIDDGRKRR
jgi:hypothetical protein